MVGFFSLTRSFKHTVSPAIWFVRQHRVHIVPLNRINLFVLHKNTFYFGFYSQRGEIRNIIVSYTITESLGSCTACASRVSLHTFLKSLISWSLFIVYFAYFLFLGVSMYTWKSFLDIAKTVADVTKIENRVAVHYSYKTNKHNLSITPLTKQSRIKQIWYLSVYLQDLLSVSTKMLNILLLKVSTSVRHIFIWNDTSGFLTSDIIFSQICQLNCKFTFGLFVFHIPKHVHIIGAVAFFYKYFW